MRKGIINVFLLIILTNGVTKIYPQSSDTSAVDPIVKLNTYVQPTDTAYFHQLCNHESTKAESDKIKNKAVIYAVLQDTILNAELKKILGLSQFEILCKMPGSDYRFSKISGAWLKDHPEDLVYKDRVQWYLAYKTHLVGLELDEEIKQLDEQSKQLDEKSKQLEEKSKRLDKEIELLEKLLGLYKGSENKK